jgi:hypothetical protein
VRIINVIVAPRPKEITTSPIAQRIPITTALIAILSISLFIIIRNGDLPVPIGAGIGITIILITHNRAHNRCSP